MTTHKRPAGGSGEAMTITSIPEQTRTMVRLTGFRNGGVVLVDPLAVLAVSQWDGTEPRTVITLRDKNGTIPVRETPTEVHNLLMRAGVRVIGADTDDRGIGYGEFIVQMSRTVDVPPPPTAPAPGKGEH